MNTDNTHKPYLYFFFGSIIFLVLVIFYILNNAGNYEKDKNTVIQKNNIEAIEATTTPSAFSAKNLEGKYYKVSFEIPSNNNGVSDFFTKHANDWLDSSGVKNPTAEEVKNLFFEDSACKKYEYTQTLSKTESTGYESYNGEVYEFTCGAHGSTYNLIYNIDKSNSKRVELLSDVYKSEVFEFLSNYAKQNLPLKLKQNGINVSDIKDMFDAGTSLDPENYNTFYFDKDHLVIVFGQYSIGPYAMGITQMPVPISLLDKYKK